MIVLDATNRSLEINLADAITTANLPVVSSWADFVPAADTYTPGTTTAASNGTTAVTIVAAPGASTQRQIKFITVYNADSAAAVVTIQYNDNTTLRIIVKITLAVGDTLIYTDGEGWRVIDSMGKLKHSTTALSLPTSSTDNAAVRWDGTGGNAVQNSVVTISDTGDVAGVVALACTTIELGHASDTTLARVSAGVVSIEGVNIVTVSATQTLTNKTLTTPTISGAITFPDNVRQTFNPGADAAGINVGAIAGDPGTPSNGDLWYDSTANELTARINGANVALGAGGGGGATAALDNLASVAINTSLISDTDLTDDLGSTSIAWNVAYLGSVVLRDNGLDHNLTIALGTNLTAARAFTLYVADAAVDFKVLLTEVTFTGSGTFTVSSTNSPTLTISASTTIDQDLQKSASPQFAGVNVGHASDTTIARAAAGRLTVESVAIVRGPGSATDNTLPRFDGTTGDLIQTSGIAVDDSNNVSGVGTFSSGTITTSGSIELGHASDTTLARSSAGVVTIEGNVIYRAGGTDVPVTDGGTGASTAGAARRNLGLTLLNVFYPFDNQPPASNYATLDFRNGHPVLDFDATTNESAIFTGALPATYGGNGLTVQIAYSMTSATTLTVDWDAEIERIGDSQLDIDADSFAAANSVDDTTVPGTSGHVDVVEITFTDGADMDSLAAGEQYRIRITRDAASDDATGDAELHWVRVLETT